jgi:hypothetical protein
VTAFRLLPNVGANPIVTTSSNNLHSFLSFPEVIQQFTQNGFVFATKHTFLHKV